MKKVFQEITPKSRADFRDWLKKNHEQKESIWVVIFKISSPNSNLNAVDVAEEALCFGWIDSVPRKLDEYRYKLLVSQRKPLSTWSAINKKRVKALIAKGLMTKYGLEKIKIAKKNGAWTMLNSSDRFEVPSVLEKRLKRNKKAYEFYQSMAPSSKRIILEWINSAKTDETRNKRIKETVQLAAKGIRANHYVDLKKLKNNK
ncbi:YdeI/OmpD-associated family protein [Fluviispira vulneris]|uniref:YdeI/OmpD-associated family protein n=1 Tax=Fluviispira vulneris TaxID=2763012 RepID=UPI0016479415|nr:YdeI/OmpD-associated family protein [Fluviispira vulneris]